VQQRLSLPTLCELTFFEPNGPLATAAGPKIGTKLRLTVRDHSIPLFEGELTALEYDYEPSRGRVVRLRGYDPLHRLRKRQPVRPHPQVDLVGLARELVADLDIAVQVAAPGLHWPQLIQYDQSDFELLQELAERAGLHFTLRGRMLHLLTLAGLGEPALSLTWGDSLFEARLAVNGDLACRTVTVGGWDPSRAASYGGRASTARVGRDTPVEVAPSSV